MHCSAMIKLRRGVTLALSHLDMRGQFARTSNSWFGLLCTYEFALLLP